MKVQPLTEQSNLPLWWLHKGVDTKKPIDLGKFNGGGVRVWNTEAPDYSKELLSRRFLQDKSKVVVYLYYLHS
ncbi:Putative dipeptidyl aminopeptidase [Frankliniella fusca]|uniref:Dipeptidyl aminopeptidase n=1 Tax=Frankliniella fusca TaxID=407009 RepID=A0AAE1HD38_9NEOP|nr:Putative dipeptidyl aminopeptidase [Frankliniella fusca]